MPRETDVKSLARHDDRIELLRRLKQVRAESVRRWGRMTAHQMVCHLNDAFRMATGDKAVSHASALHQRTIVKWIALYLPVPWPAGVSTRPEIDQNLDGTHPGEFAADVAQLETMLMTFGVDPQTLHGHRHPMFGGMSESAWLRWGYLHVDHHLRQFGA